MQDVKSKAVETEVVDVVVVGAGFAGLYAIYEYRRLGFRVRAFEAGSGVGGTWYWNRYPGARCDAPSLDYSFSFSQELEREWDWSEHYATQPEILSYLEHVADRFDLHRDIVFETRVVSAIYSESDGMWEVKTDRGHAVQARFCVLATGSLSAARLPAIPGVESFKGVSYHTAAWPDQGVELAGNRVGVIGTGSTGIQLIPIVAESAAQLIVFQRTPAYSIPAGNRPLSAQEREEAKAAYPDRRAMSRMSPNGLPITLSEVSALEVSEAGRFVEYDRGWHDGTPILFPYNDLLTNQEANDTAAEFIKHKIRAIVRDPADAAALTTQDYPLGAKRLALDTGYYETFNRENVSLVDVRARPIVEIDASGVRTDDAHYELDVLIYATGFDALTGAASAIEILGEGGKSLQDTWSEGPRTYLGVAVAGFPNLFLIAGPGSPSVLSNMVVSIEQHIEWTSGLLSYMKEGGFSRFVANADAQDDWVNHVNEIAGYTLFPKAASWYLGANIPGKPRVFMPYAGGVGAYRTTCDELAQAGYKGFSFS